MQAPSVPSAVVYVPKTKEEIYERDLHQFGIRLQDINLFRPSYPRTPIAYSRSALPPLAASQATTLTPALLTSRAPQSGLSPTPSQPGLPLTQPPPPIPLAVEAPAPQAEPAPGPARTMSKTEWDKAYSEETFRDELVDKSVILRYATVVSLKLQEKGDKLATEIAKLEKEIRNLRDKGVTTTEAEAKRTYLQGKLTTLQRQERLYLTDIQAKVGGRLSEELTKRLTELPEAPPLAPGEGAVQTGVMFNPNGNLTTHPENRFIMVKMADGREKTVDHVMESDYRRLVNSIKWQPPIHVLRRFLTPRRAKNNQADEAAAKILAAMDIVTTNPNVIALSSKSKRMLAVMLIHGKISTEQANKMIGAKSAKELNGLLGQICSDYQTRQKSMHKLGIRLKIGDEKKDAKVQERMIASLAKHVCQFGEEIARVAFKDSKFPINKTGNTFFSKFGERLLNILCGAAGGILSSAITATSIALATGTAIALGGWIAIGIAGGVATLFLTIYLGYLFVQHMRGR